MSLLHAEWRRLFMRRFTRWSLVLVAGILAVAALSLVFSSQKLTPEIIAEAEAQAAVEYEAHRAEIEREMEQCEKDLEEGRLGLGWLEDCSEIETWLMDQEEMVSWYLPWSFDFRSNYQSMVTVLAGLLAMYAFLVGASFIGAEWRSGGMMNLLLWHPRRLQVFGAKAASLLIGITGIYVVMGLAWTGVIWLVAAARGSTEGMTSGAWQSFGLSGLRGFGLVVAAGLVGFALASIGRHIGAALGTAIAAVVVGVVGINIVVRILGVKYPLAWVWTTYIEAWLNKVLVLENWDVCAQSTEPVCTPDTLEITWQTSGLLMAGVVAALVGVAMWQMRRRDIA